jgi:23S rRNA pseudouridine1911/1915/1917 synthase
VAIVYGVINHNLGKIDAPIGRHPTNRQQMAVVEGGKPSVTHFKVIERFKEHTLIELNLETGRTHQIRVHMTYIGHPLLGDPVYGPKKVVGTTGQFLHAKVLGFVHPRTKEYMEFTSELPDYFQAMIETLRNQ